MAGSGTEAAHPQDSDKSKLQGDVVLSGQISGNGGLREVLEIIMSSKDVQHGVMRVLSKDVRGYVGVFCGSVIVGGHVTSTREYGVPALRKLLAANRGMFVFMSVDNFPIELRQGMTLSIEELLNWRPIGAQSAVPTLSEALNFFGARHADVIATNTECGEALRSGLLSTDIGTAVSEAEEEADFASYMAWGGEAPVLSTNLAKITGSLLKPLAAGDNPKPVVERIIDTLENANGPATVAVEIPQPPIDFSPSTPPQTQEDPAEQQPSESASKWDLADLDAIPTPGKTGAPSTPKATTGGASSAAFAKPNLPPPPAVADPIGASPDKASSWTAGGNAAPGTTLNTAGTKDAELFSKNAFTRPNAMPTEPSPNTSSSSSSNASSNANANANKVNAAKSKMREFSQQDKELSQLVTQRMKVVDTKSFINDAPRDVLSPTERRKVEIMALAGGIVGVGLFLALGQQVFNITMSASKYQSGIKALKAGNNVLAQVDLTAAINLGTGTQAFLYRGLAETRLGHTDNALKDFEQVLRREPKNMTAYEGRVALFIKNKEYAQALDQCDQMLKLQPDYIDAYRLRALAHCANGDWKDAMDDASMYLAKAGTTDDTKRARSEVLACRAYAYNKLKKYDAAIADYTDAIELDNDNSHLYSSRGVVYKRVKAYVKALADANKAIELDPSDPSLYRLRGLCFQAAGDALHAATDLDKAVKMRPSVDNFLERGLARLDAKDYENALVDFEYVLTVQPNNQLAKARYALCRSALQGSAKPIVSLAELQATSPQAKTPPLVITGTASELCKKGYDALRAGKVDNAVSILTAAVKGNPNDLNARRYLAHALTEKGDAAGAASAFATLSTMQPLTNHDRLAYAKALVVGGNLESAANMYNAIVGTEPNNDSARLGLIDAYMKLGKLPEAAGLAQQGMRQSPQLVARYQALYNKATGK